MTERLSYTGADLTACCSITYGHPLSRWLLGESMHPGGLALTSRLARLMGIESSSNVLDAGSGRGASAVHLSRTLGCRVTAVTLESAGAEEGVEQARRFGVDDRVSFVIRDFLDHDSGQGIFDSVLMECVLSIFADKAAVVRHVKSLLRPGGRLGLTDVTLDGPLPPELSGVVATAGCVGGALSLDEYRALLEDEGLVVERRQDCREAATSFLRDLKGKLLMAELATRLGKLRVSDSLVSQAKRLLRTTQDLVEKGDLGYGLLVARNPGD